MASATPDNPRVSASSVRRFIKPVSLSRLRVETTANWRGVVGAVERVEDFFFIIGIWVCVSAFLRSRDAVGLALRGVDAWIQETSRCRKGPFSCWAEFGQAFSMLKGKLSAATSVTCRGSCPRCIDAPRHLKATPSLNIHARTPQALRARPAAYRFARQLTEPCVICSCAARGEWRGEKL